MRREHGVKQQAPIKIAWLGGRRSYRDTAIITVLIDTGMRPIEVPGLRHAANPLESDVDFDYNVLHATGTRGKRRALQENADKTELKRLLGLRTAQMLSRYRICP